MWNSLLIVAVLVLAVFAARRTWASVLRARAGRLVPPEVRLRAEGNIPIRVLLYRTRSFRGMDPKRVNRTLGDLLLSSDRFVIASNRGVLVDVGPDRGRRFTSARCTGPGRLIIEGEIPNPGQEMGLYRFELSVADAAAWATALEPFVAEPGKGPRYAVRPPGW